MMEGYELHFYCVAFQLPKHVHSELNWVVCFYNFQNILGYLPGFQLLVSFLSFEKQFSGLASVLFNQANIDFHSQPSPKLTKILAKIQLTQFIEKIKSTKIIAKIKLLTNHQLRLDFQTMSGFVTASKGECTDYLTAKGDLEVLLKNHPSLRITLAP